MKSSGHAARSRTTSAAPAPPGHDDGPNAAALRPPPSGIDWLDQSRVRFVPALEAEADRVASHVARTRSPTPSPSSGPLPAATRRPFERLSGLDLGDVRTVANSPEPARIGALATAQGNQIHLAPGQGQHLPHEIWHVVQQRQGRLPAPPGHAPPLQPKFSPDMIRRIALLSMEGRIDLLSAVSEEDLESWYDSAQFGSMLTGGEEADEIRDRRKSLRESAELESLVQKLDAFHITDPMDDLVEAFGRLAINDPMDLVPTVEIQRARSDADGDIHMQEIDGTVDVEMTDVHGTMDVQMSDVAPTGTVEMEIDHVDADVEMSISDVDGYVRIALSDVDLSPQPSPHQPTPGSRGALRLDIHAVHGVLDLRVEHCREPMEISPGPVEAEDHVTRRIQKRKWEPGETEEAPETTERHKRPKWSPPTLPADDEVDALTESFTGLDLREPFFAEIDHHVHELYPATNLSDLIVQSDPVPLATVIAKKKWQGVAIGGAALAQLKLLAGTAGTALKAMSSPTKTKANTLRKAMKEIAKELGKLTPVPPPKTVLTGTNYPSNGGKTEGKYVKADPLSLNTQNSGTIGSGPTNDSRLMDAIRAVATPLGENKSYKMMHLLNHKVFGPGELWNMTPGPSASNIRMEKDVEDPLKRAIHDKGLVIGFEATVDYKSDPMLQPQAELNRNPDGYRFKTINFKAWEYELNHAGNAFSKRSATPDPDVQAIDGAKVKWDYGGLTVLREKPRILDPNTTVQDLLDAGLPPAAANKIWQFNQDVLAHSKTAFTVPKSNKKEALINHIKHENSDKRSMPGNWDATKVNWS